MNRLIEENSARFSRMGKEAEIDMCKAWEELQQFIG